MSGLFHAAQRFVSGKFELSGFFVRLSILFLQVCGPILKILQGKGHVIRTVALGKSSNIPALGVWLADNNEVHTLSGA